MYGFRKGQPPSPNAHRGALGTAHATGAVIIAYMRSVPRVMCSCLWTVIFPAVRFPMTDA